MVLQKSRFLDRLEGRLYTRQSGASLAVFRILVGILILKDVRNHFLLIKYHLESIPSDFMMHYYGFEWVKPLPWFIAIQEIVLPLAVLCVIFGLFYRVAMPLTTLMIAYVFLLFPEHYLNHYYMLLLFCTLMSFMPASRTWSLDALIKKRTDEGVPAWCYWILRGQTEIVLIYAGLVKINPDWLNLQPLSTWLRADFHDVPVIGGLFYYDFTIFLGAYGIILLHTIGAPLLMWSKARPWIFGLYVCFHLTNSMIFDIGMFPFLTIGATLLFFNPDWPRILYFGKGAPQTFTAENKPEEEKQGRRGLVTGLLITWLGVQALLPLPALMSSNLQTAWTGHRDLFSWRMMLNQRTLPVAVFVAYMPEKHTVAFVPLRKYISKRQCQRSVWKPNLTVQVARYLKKRYAERYETPDVEIRAYILNAVNYREPELWADPSANLAAYVPIYGVHEWLEPVDNPLRSWLELIRAPKVARPTYRQVLKAMRLPEGATVAFDQNGAELDSTVPDIECNALYQED
ncbi:MAG: HTTM domain-containing protein [Alphaproteobacteria bacterium]|nr:HTTM domain-containing protein [Alphaproteobacteria bacterium]MCB9975644.1 HTTM domain-containing protein [Rhodospirillales bacterium]